MAKKREYGNESITALKGPDKVRKRPAVIFGSEGLEGCFHSFFEILSNSLDEAREGYGTAIEVTHFKDHSIEIVDHARGIPVDYNSKEEKFNWELLFCDLYAGGKYANEEGGNYEYSIGTNGLGLCATQCSSEYMDAIIMRDGYKYSLHFEKGYNVGGLVKEPTRFKQTGSKIRWKPDPEVFTDINIPKEMFIETLRRQAIINSNVTITFFNETDEGMEKFEFSFPDGIVGYIKEVADGKNFTDVYFAEGERWGKDRANEKEAKIKIQIAFSFSNTTPILDYYHNSSYLENGGSPDKATRNAFTAAVDAYLKQNGKYQKNESKINFSDIEDSLMFVSSCFSSRVSYENQTKKAVTNKYIQDTMTEFIRQQLDIYFIENKADAEKIANQVLINKHSREKAEKTRNAIKNNLTKALDVTNRVNKFVDCRSKDTTRREVYIVEGDSALGACKQGRDSEFQAIIPVRGKILNCLKADYDKIFKSDIIVDLLRVLGCGVEIKTKHNKDFNSFDIDNLRWSKVIICTDADVDGFQIRTLILTMIYRLVPSLIEKGKVYIAESPLFEITHKKDTYFAYTEAEKAQIISKFKDDNYKIQRSKGLGENEPEMMWLTTMNPETRRLIRVTPSDAQMTETMFDLLLGDNLEGRKEYIATEGGKYTEMLDLS